MYKYFTLLFILVTFYLKAQPPVTNGLTLYLDAATGLSGSNPAIWRDQSGLGNDVSTDLTLGVDPVVGTVRGRSTIRFNGNSIMVSANPTIVTGTTGTIFSVVSRFTSGAKVSVSSDNDLGQELLLLNNIAYHNSTANNFVGLGHQCIASIPIDSTVIESATYRPQRFLSDITHYVNGVIANQSVVNNYGSPIDYFNVGRYARIGGRIWFTNPNSTSDLYRPMISDIHEVLIYDRELTQAEVDLVHEYLKCKYNVNYAVCNIPISCTFTAPVREIVWQDSCVNNSINFSLSNTTLLDSVLWSFGDPPSGNNTSTLLNPTHVYTGAGNYIVQALTWYNGIADTIVDTISIYSNTYALNLGADTTYCNSFNRLLDATQTSTATYLWQNGSTASTQVVSAPGQYWVRVSGPCDTLIDTIDFDLLFPISLTVADTTICSGTVAILNASNPTTTTYLWQDGSTNPQYLALTLGQYWVTASNACYSATDTAEVFIFDTIQYTPLVDTTLCQGDILQLNVGSPGAVSYIWENGSIDSLRTINTAGTYWVEISNPCETIRDTIEVDYILNPSVDLGPDIVACSTSGTLTILNAGVHDNYLWQDGSTLPSYVVTAAGQYSVTVSNVCLSATDTVVVSVTDSIQWTALSDTTLCQGDVLQINVGSPGAVSYLWENGSIDSLRTINTAGIYWVEVSNSCETIGDTMVIDYILNPTVDLGPDIVSCSTSGALTILNAGINDNYLWQDGSSLPSYVVTAAGQYSVTVSNVCLSATDTVVVSVTDSIQWTALSDTTLCQGDVLQLNVGSPGAVSYVWENGSTDTLRTIDTSGVYWIEVSNPCETIRDTMVVDYILNPIVDLGPDIISCTGADTIAILDAGTHDNYLWQDGSASPLYVVTIAGQYSVTVSNVCQSATDTINVSISAPLQWDFINDTARCEDELITLNVGQLETAGYTWQWNDSITDTVRVFNEAGTYWLQIDNGCNQIIDTIVVTYYRMPTLDLGPDVTICGIEGATEFLLDAGESDSFVWHDGSTTNQYDASQTGVYSVTVTTIDGCVAADTIEVVKEGIYIPNAFSPNGDGNNDHYKIYGLCIDGFKLQIFNNWGSLVFQTTDINELWDGTYRGVLLHPGVFVYQLFYSDYLGKDHYQKGSIMLLR